MATGLNPAVLPQGMELGKSDNGSPFFFMVHIFCSHAFYAFVCATGCKQSCLLWQLEKHSVVQDKKERVMSFWSPVNEFLIFSAALANPYFSMGNLLSGE